ncbi:MAG: hypothetical protein FD138_1502, partial [Planctomycetota bacterium]
MFATRANSDRDRTATRSIGQRAAGRSATASEGAATGSGAADRAVSNRSSFGSSIGRVGAKSANPVASRKRRSAMIGPSVKCGVIRQKSNRSAIASDAAMTSNATATRRRVGRAAI